MIKYSYKSLKSYYGEVKFLNLDDFNKFIFNDILLKSLKLSNVLPIIIGLAIIVFSFIVQQSIYVFIPQSSITTFATYMIFTGAISLLVLIIYPLLIIFLLNYVGQRIRECLRGLFLPLKLLVLVAAFYICVGALANIWLTLMQQVYITLLWLSLYFVLINLYLSYLNSNKMIRVTRFRLLFVIFFIGLLAKPYLLMFVRTSEMIDYTSINPMIYLSKANCELISNPIHLETNPANLTINDSDSVVHQDNGECLIKWESVRYGFANDYVLIFKKNINPVEKDGLYYNVYVRLNCYAGNCYSDDDKYILQDRDVTGSLIKKNRQNRLI